MRMPPQARDKLQLGRVYCFVKAGAIASKK
jgi:hypothetical protein